MKARLLICIAILSLFSCHSAFSEWKNIFPGFGFSDNASIVVRGDYVFTGHTFGIQISTNKGKTWRFDKLLNTSIDYVTMIDNYLYASGYKSFNKSSDNGKSWISISEGLNDNTVYSLVADGNKLIAGTYSGVYVSTNQGISWDSIGLSGYSIGSIIKIKNIICASAYSKGVYLSSDNGQNWIKGILDTNIIDSVNFYFNGFAQKGDSIFATSTRGFFLSVNNGMNWKKIHHFGFNTLAIKGDSLYGVANFLVYLSTDYGENWEEINKDEYHRNLHSITINGDEIYIGGRGEMHKSTNCGKNWQTLTRYTQHYETESFIVNEEKFYFSVMGEIFFSNDGGKTWGMLSDGLANYTGAIAIRDSNIFLGMKGGINHSADNGNTYEFIPLTGKYVLSLAIDDKNIFAGTDSGGVFLSTDNGKSWELRGLVEKTIISLGISGNYIFAGSKLDGIYRSSDYGLNWEKLSPDLKNSHEITFSIYDKYIYAKYNDYIHLSTDNGDNWKTVYPANYATIVLALEDIVFVSGVANPTTFSTDYGENWNVLKITPYGILGHNSALSAFNDTLYVFGCSDPYGIYYESIKNILATETVPEESMQSGKMKIYPNPAHYNISIDLANPLFRAADYRIIDAMGRTVSTGIFPISASNENCNVDISGLAPGIYHIILSVEKDLQTGSFVKLRD